MIRVLMTLVCCLFVVPAFSYDDEAKEEIFLSTPEQVAALSSKPANLPELILTKISQGALSNGMCFYSCPFGKYPENEVTFSVIVKKTDQTISLPSFDFFQEALEYKGSIESSIISTSGYYSFTVSIWGDYFLPTTSILVAIVDYLENFDMSVDCIEKIRKEYAKDLQEDSESIDGMDLRTLSDDQIRGLYREQFNPSQMGIVITGGFDSTDFAIELENTLGKLIGKKFSGNSFNEKIPCTMAAREELPWDIIDRDSSSEDRMGYEYVYPITPTFKSHVLKDLFRLIGLEKGIILPQEPFYHSPFLKDPYKFGNLYPIGSFFSKEKITNFECDEHFFALSKQKLFEIYRNISIFDDLNCSSHSIIISHFLSEIPESLEDDQTFERVLEEITFEDFQAFVEENFSKIKYFEEE